MSRLYFAYGSNMGAAQMRDRCPENCLLGPAELDGYRWIVNARGYANIVADEQGTVVGLLYLLSSSDEESLDGFEGVAQGNYRKVQLAVRRGGERVMALVYIDPVEAEGVPRLEYIGRINAALRDADLPAAYIAGVVRRFIPADPQG